MSNSPIAPSAGRPSAEESKSTVADWPFADLLRALTTGVLPEELPHNGNPYHDDVYIGEGPLAAAFEEALSASGLKRESLVVLSTGRDPFALDTPAAHRDAAWFLEHFQRLVGERRIDLHGFHYVLVAAGGVIKPNGEPYRNTHADDVWLSDVAGKRARWLRYIDFNRIDDNRNDEPVIYRPDQPSPPAARISAVAGFYSLAEIEEASPDDSSRSQCSAASRLVSLTPSPSSARILALSGATPARPAL